MSSHVICDPCLRVKYIWIYGTGILDFENHPSTFVWVGSPSLKSPESAASKKLLQITFTSNYLSQVKISSCYNYCCCCCVDLFCVDFFLSFFSFSFLCIAFTLIISAVYLRMKMLFSTVLRASGWFQKLQTTVWATEDHFTVCNDSLSYHVMFFQSQKEKFKWRLDYSIFSEFVTEK